MNNRRVGSMDQTFVMLIHLYVYDKHQINVTIAEDILELTNVMLCPSKVIG